MKIDNSVKNVAGIVIGNNSRRTDRAAGADPQAAGAHDRIELSPLSAQLHAIENNLSGDGVLDTVRIQEIKQAIREGRFKVNAEVVADRLLDTVRELLQTHRNGSQ